MKQNITKYIENRDRRLIQMKMGIFTTNPVAKSLK